MIGLKQLVLLKHGAPPRNVLEAALRAKWGGGGGASYEKTVGPAPIISISDAKAKPAKSLIVGMEPIQDLHGYDSPWPAGGGKNLWNPQPYTGLNYNIDVGLSVTLTESTGVTVNGNKLSFSVPVGWDYKDFKTKPLAAGTYRIHFSNSLESGFRGTWYVVGDTGAGDVVKKKETFSSIAGDRDKNITVETNDYIVLQVASVNVTTIELVDWQIESGSSYTSWSPYSNLCPISGRTGVTVERTGKNLFDKSAAKIASTRYMYIGANSVNGEPNGSFFLADGNYTLSLSGANSTNAESLTAVDAENNRLAIAYNTKTLSFTNSVLGAVKIIIVIKSADFISWDNYDIMLNLGSSALPYEAYTGNTFPVVFPALGKNLYNLGSQTTSQHNTYNIIDLEPNTDYVFSVDVTQTGLYAEYDNSGTWTTYKAVYNHTVLTFNSGTYTKLRLMTYSNSSNNPTQFQLEIGTAVSPYEPYTNTVYGCTVDVVSGELTVTHGMVDLGTAGFTYNSGLGFWTKPAIDGAKKAVSNSTPVSAFCSIAKSVRASGYTSSHAVGTFAENESGTWFIDNGNSTTLDGQLCYELATPQTYHLTPTQIQLLKGSNTLWSDADDLTLTYIGTEPEEEKEVIPDGE